RDSAHAITHANARTNTLLRRAFMALWGRSRSRGVGRSSRRSRGAGWGSRRSRARVLAQKSVSSVKEAVPWWREGRGKKHVCSGGTDKDSRAGVVEEVAAERVVLHR